MAFLSPSSAGDTLHVNHRAEKQTESPPVLPVTSNVDSRNRIPGGQQNAREIRSLSLCRLLSSVLDRGYCIKIAKESGSSF